MDSRIKIYVLIIFSAALFISSFCFMNNKAIISSSLIILSIGLVASMTGIALLSLDQRLRNEKGELKNEINLKLYILGLVGYLF